MISGGRTAPRTCLVVQHLEPERPYVIAESLARRGVEVDLRLVARGDPLPQHLDAHDALVVMGGPMSASSDDGFPTRLQEVALLEAALAQGAPCLGVCLGAQLLATAAGSTVYRGLEGPEVGWGEVTLGEEAAQDALFAGAGPLVTVLHWHSETFDLPAGAVRLASSSLYPNQAFRAGAAAWGLQFHIEVDALAVEAFVHSFADEAEAAGTAPSEVLSGSARCLDRLAPVRDTVLDRFAALI